MERKNKTILLIENQIKQFNSIYSKLDKAGYDVLPLENDYPDFIDWIKIFVDGRYSGDREGKFTKKISDYLSDKPIDIFIIDYKLAGSIEGLTGIELRNNLRGIDFLAKQPTIFLSRTPANEKKVKDDFKIFEDGIWIEKGYAGMQLMDEDYFKIHILDVIPVMIQNTETEIIKKRLNELKEHPLMKKDGIADIIKKLLTRHHFTEDEKKFIDEFKNMNGMSSTKIEKIINQYNYITW